MYLVQQGPKPGFVPRPVVKCRIRHLPFSLFKNNGSLFTFSFTPQNKRPITNSHTISNGLVAIPFNQELLII
jgi:hypothetical protein